MGECMGHEIHLPRTTYIAVKMNLLLYLRCVLWCVLVSASNVVFIVACLCWFSFCIHRSEIEPVTLPTMCVVMCSCLCLEWCLHCRMFVLIFVSSSFVVVSTVPGQTSMTQQSWTATRSQSGPSCRVASPSSRRRPWYTTRTTTAP